MTALYVIINSVSLRRILKMFYFLLSMCTSLLISTLSIAVVASMLFVI